MKNKGLIFCFEGGEAVGKSSTLAIVAERLREKGFDVLETCEPQKTEFGIKIRNLLFESGDIAKGTEFFLFLADRCEHIEKVINPALEAGIIVLCDRFDVSTLVYQGLAKPDKDKDQLKLDACYISTQGLDMHRVRRILFDCSPETAYDRLQKRGSLNRYDDVTIERLADIRHDYRQLLDEGAFDAAINAELPQARTVNSIVSYIESEITQDIFKSTEEKCKN